MTARFAVSVAEIEDVVSVRAGTYRRSTQELAVESLFSTQYDVALLGSVQPSLAVASCPFGFESTASDSMGEDRKSPPEEGKPANDNRPSAGEAGDEEAAPRQQVDRVVLDIARMIGRRMAREDFAAQRAANDNVPPTANHGHDGTDKD